MENEILTTGTDVKNVESKSKKKVTSKKKLLSTTEFPRIGAVAVAIKRLNGYSDKEKVIKLADKIYTEKTGAKSNERETNFNFLFAIRFLREYEKK